MEQAMTRPRTSSIRATGLWTAITVSLLALGTWGVVIGIISVARAVLIPLAGLLMGQGR